MSAESESPEAKKKWLSRAIEGFSELFKGLGEWVAMEIITLPITIILILIHISILKSCD